MKQPIEPADIRKGDLIRSEARGNAPFRDNLLASEWIAEDDDTGADFRSVRLYLLDRPKPAVELPTEPTLGWLTRYVGEESTGLGLYRTRLGRFSASGRGAEFADEVDSFGAHVDTIPDVTAFTHATAVPTGALDELRAIYARHTTPGCIDHVAAGRLLDAVDEANS